MLRPKGTIWAWKREFRIQENICSIMVGIYKGQNLVRIKSILEICMMCPSADSLQDLRLDGSLGAGLGRGQSDLVTSAWGWVLGNYLDKQITRRKFYL